MGYLLRMFFGNFYILFIWLDFFMLYGYDLIIVSLFIIWRLVVGIINKDIEIFFYDFFGIIFFFIG